MRWNLKSPASSPNTNTVKGYNLDDQEQPTGENKQQLAALRKAARAMSG
jgi:hypothetical protein